MDAPIKNIDKPGDYKLSIMSAGWRQSQKGVLFAEITGVTDIDGEPRKATGYLYMSDTYIQGGKNKGRQLFEVNSDTLAALGMTKTGKYVNPAEIDRIIGAEAWFVMDWEQQQDGGARLVVKYINAGGGGERLTNEEAADIFRQLAGSGAQPGKVEPPKVKPQPVSDADVSKMMDSAADEGAFNPF